MNKSFLKNAAGLFFIILGAGCARNSPEITQSQWEKLIAIRGEAREHCRRDALAGFQRSSSEDTSNTNFSMAGPDSGRSRDLGSNENLRLLQKIEDSYLPDSEDERKVRRLRHYLMEVRMNVMTEEVEQYLAEMRMSATFSLGKRSVGLGQLQTVLQTAQDRDLRQQAYYVWLPELEKENAVIEHLVVIRDSAAVDLGYGDFASLSQERQQFDYSLLREQAEAFIQSSDSLYHALAETVVPQLTGLRFDMLRGYDIPFLTYASPFDGYFHGSGQLDRVEAALDRMGLTLGTDERLLLAFEKNKGNLRPATYPITIPDDIRMILPADSGQWASSALLHELGHALHWLNTTEREFEFTQLGAGGLQESYAFLIEGLLDEPEFLEEVFGIPHQRVAELLRQRAFMQLEATRSYCGDFLFEQQVYAGGTDLRTTFEEIKQPISDYSWNEVDRELLFRRLDRFASAEYLTGWFLSAQLREYLRREFGERWFTEPAAGDFLKNLWKHGTRKSEFEVAAMLGDSTIAPDALLRHLNSISSQ